MLIENKIVCLKCKATIELKAKHISIDESIGAVFADDKRAICECGSDKLAVKDSPLLTHFKETRCK